MSIIFQELFLRLPPLTDFLKTMTNLKNAKSVWGEKSAQYRAALEVAESAGSEATKSEKPRTGDNDQPWPQTGGLTLALRLR